MRGYITGSAWAEYQKWGTVNGVRMEKGMVESQQLSEPMFTPTTKADEGHDEPMTFSDLIQEVGPEAAQVLRLRSAGAVQVRGGDARTSAGIIIADTKFEFGYIDDELHVIDEILTPDSSRFWEADNYEAGKPQPSFDKQYVRDWLAQTRLEQGAAGAGAAGRRRAGHVGAVQGGVPAADGAGSAVAGLSAFSHSATPGAHSRGAPTYCRRACRGGRTCPSRRWRD